MGWRDEYKVHPAADIFPMMSDDEQASTLPTDGRSEGAVVVLPPKVSRPQLALRPARNRGTMDKHG